MLSVNLERREGSMEWMKRAEKLDLFSFLTTIERDARFASKAKFEYVDGGENRYGNHPIKKNSEAFGLRF